MRVRYQVGNYNDRLTVPLVIFGKSLPGLLNISAWFKILSENKKLIKADFPFDVVVVELGTDGPGQLNDFAYLQPDISVVTSVAPEHMEFFKTLDAVVTPLFEGLRYVAPIAWVPIAALWFGTGIGGPTLIIFAGAFPPCVVNAYRGARQVEPVLIEAARMLGLSNLRMIMQVLLPAAVPSIIAGVRVSAGLGWQSLVGAELIVASSGVGYLMVKGQSSISTAIVMSGMVAIGVVGLLIDIGVRQIEAAVNAKRGK